MKLKSKTFKNNNYFVLYDLNDNVICLYDNFEELSKDFTYELRNLVFEYNRNKTNIITIIIGNKKYKLATFC